MKKIIFPALLVCTLSLASCFKSYDCDCQTPNNTTEMVGEFKGNKRHGKEFCIEMSLCYDYQGYACVPISKP